ncbi:CIC11C00000000230 [Sungouiella intermedia]|uniref:CIC11C00000000230 n=1 Tax=Sungouiella intermedia TaxID=45354 RepID=A0A1L0BDZ7_9ASCO|nr:CIC11C00000000230 [[Candida] intermedia]
MVYNPRIAGQLNRRSNWELSDVSMEGNKPGVTGLDFGFFFFLGWSILEPPLVLDLSVDDKTKRKKTRRCG